MKLPHQIQCYYHRVHKKNISTLLNPASCGCCIQHACIICTGVGIAYVFFTHFLNPNVTSPSQPSSVPPSNQTAPDQNSNSPPHEWAKAFAFYTTP